MAEVNHEALAIALKNLLTGFVTKAYSLTPEEVTALFNADGTEVKPDALNILIQKDTARVQDLSGSSSTLLQEKFDAGYRKRSEEVENHLKGKYKANITGKKVNEIIDEVVKAAAGTGEKLTDEAVKGHRLYVELLEGVDQKIADAVAAKANEFETEKKNWNRSKVLDLVTTKALEKFNSMKPILSTDTKKANNQLKNLKDEINSYDYVIEGDRIVVMKGDQVVKNEHGHRVDFDAHVEKIANEYYDFDAGDGRTPPPPPDGKPPGAGGSTTVLKKPKDDNEFVEMYDKIEHDPQYTPDERFRLLSELTKLHTAK